jgi:hypothetical protein
MTNSIKFKSLWVGGELSLFEKACLSSFVRLGQDIELFTYEPLEVPKGVKPRDASQIIPREKVRKNSQENSYAMFSNLFRYELLWREGGCWVDTDVILLKAPEWPDTVLGYEDNEHINGAVLSLPCHVCEWLIQRFHENGYDVPWGTNGPMLVTKAVSEFNLTPLPKERLYPIPPGEWRMLIAGNPEERLKNADCVHLWNECFRRAHIDKNQIPPGWLGEKFKELL